MINIVKTSKSVKLTPELVKAVLKDAKKRKINFSRYVEIALIHELNKKGNSGTIYELKQLEKIITERIDELSPDEPEEILEDLHDVEFYIEEVKKLQNMMGYVTDGVIQRNSELAGVSYTDFLSLLREHDVKVQIVD